MQGRRKEGKQIRRRLRKEGIEEGKQDKGRKEGREKGEGREGRALKSMGCKIPGGGGENTRGG